MESTNAPTGFITDPLGLIESCQYVAEQVRLFNLALYQLEDLYRLHVYSRIPITADPMDHALLVAFARGQKVSLIHSIRTVECEEVYVSPTGVVFGTKVAMSSWPHVSSMTPKERMGAKVGYVWKDVGHFTPFTVFTPIAASNEGAAA